MEKSNKSTNSCMDKNADVPFLSAIEGIARAMFQVSDDDVLLLRNVIDSNGKLKMYHPVVQSALLALIREKSIEELKRIEAEKKAKEDEDKDTARRA